MKDMHLKLSEIQHFKKKKLAFICSTMTFAEALLPITWHHNIGACAPKVELKWLLNSWVTQREMKDSSGNFQLRGWGDFSFITTAIGDVVSAEA